jgi:hypothetical protein
VPLFDFHISLIGIELLGDRRVLDPHCSLDRAVCGFTDSGTKRSAQKKAAPEFSVKVSPATARRNFMMKRHTAKTCRHKPFAIRSGLSKGMPHLASAVQLALPRMFPPCIPQRGWESRTESPEFLWLINSQPVRAGIVVIFVGGEAFTDFSGRSPQIELPGPALRERPWQTKR